MLKGTVGLAIAAGFMVATFVVQVAREISGDQREKERNQEEIRRAQEEKIRLQEVKIRLQEEVKELKEYSFADVNGDPERFKAAQVQFKRLFLEKLPGVLDRLGSSLPDGFVQGEKNVAFIGDVSVGKSSLLNALFGLKLAASAVVTTKNFERVHTTRNINLWDTPGQNTQDQSLLYIEAIQCLKAMDLIVILYNSDLDTITDLCAMIKLLDRPTVLVQMKADQILSVEQRGEEPLSFYIERDKMNAWQWQVFACSAVDSSGTDNVRFKSFLLEPKIISYRRNQ